MRTLFGIAGVIFALLGVCLLLSGCTLTIGVKWGCGKDEPKALEVKNEKQGR